MHVCHHVCCACLQDPYVKVELGKRMKKTAVHKKGGVEPVWNEAIEFPVIPAQLMNSKKKMDICLIVSVFSSGMITVSRGDTWDDDAM